MRRRPQESTSTAGSNVFSSDAWGNSDNDYVQVNESQELAQYAASMIPEGRSNSARTARYSPSANSDAYEENPYRTNSTGNPFGHGALDNRQQPAFVPNTSVNDMPSPVRRSRLGESQQSELLQNVLPTAPQAAAPTQAVSSISTFGATAFAAPVAEPVTRPVQASQTYSAPAQAPAPTPAPAPVIQPEVIVHAPAPVIDDIEFDSPLEEEIPLSDFEEEFIVAKQGVLEEPLTVDEPDVEIDLTRFESVNPLENTSWSAPHLFTSSPVSAPTPAVQYREDFFDYNNDDESDSDRLYRDPREARETIQIDRDFVKYHGKKLIANKIVVIIFVVLIAATAYFVARPATSPKPTKVPAESSTNSSDVNKTVVDNPQGQPIVTGENPAPSSNGPTIHYDENGNAIYSGN